MSRDALLAVILGPLVSGFLVVACSGDSAESPSTTSETGVVDTATAETSPGVDSASTDAGSNDSAKSDTGSGDTGVAVPAIRLANMSGAALDFCIRNPGGPIGTPAFAASGGIPAGSVSAYYPFKGLVIDYLIKYVPAGTGCDVDAGFAEEKVLGNSTLRRTRWHVGSGGMPGGGYFDTAKPTAGQDTVLFAEMQDESTLKFVPDGDPSAVVAIGTTTTLPPGVAGKLVGTVSGFPAPADRPFKTAAGGLVRVFMTSTAILVCDELAPPVGALSDCRPSVRAP